MEPVRLQASREALISRHSEKMPRIGRSSILGHPVRFCGIVTEMDCQQNGMECAKGPKTQFQPAS